MAVWTEPQSGSFAVGDAMTGAILNKYHSANQQLGIHRIVTQLEDETSTTTTLRESKWLNVIQIENATWSLVMVLLWTDSTGGTADLKLDFATSGSSSYKLSAIVNNNRLFWVGGSGAQAVPALSTGVQATVITGWYTPQFTNTGQSLTMQWAQNTASGTTTMKAGSTIFGSKL